jgi:2-polyprenyl-3-methyl-5-hydroxy-6-metoxy-1,4-benzoquinol methylase
VGTVGLREADNWDQHYGGHAALVALNPAVALRRELVNELLCLDAARQPVRVLELGSGTGLFARDIMRAYPAVEFVGLDLSETGVRISAKNAPGAQFFQQDFALPIKILDSHRAWATHVVCSEVLEHLDDPANMLRNIRPLFAPGCRIIVTVPGGPRSEWAKFIGHRRHYTCRSLEATLKDAGLEVDHVYGAGFPFFNLYVLAALARGKRIIADAGRDGGQPSLSARLGFSVFDQLFKLNSNRTRLGWQIAAVAREPRVHA